MRRFLVAIATAMLFAVLVAPPALASPKVVESDPASGAEEHEAPDTVSITFDMPLADDSVIKVIDECGRQIDAKNTTVQLNEMSVDLAKKPSGHYKAFYYANPPAGATGSATGVIEFHVHMGPSCGPEATTHHHGGSGNEHEGHEGHEGSGHEGHDNHSTNADHNEHSTHSAHLSAGHSHMSAGHTDHTHAAGTSHADHGQGGGHHHRNGGSNGGVNAAGTNPAPRAAGPGESQLSDAQAVLISLGACLLLGVAGGWMVRTTQAPRRTA